MPKCVELTAVYDDGTVERWETPNGYLPFVGEPGTACYQPTTTTKPLRKVTVMEGSHYTDYEGQVIESADILGGNMDLSALLPNEIVARPVEGNVDGTNGLRCRLRITVEAVPAEVQP
jgi:hypothetical protein